MIPSSNHARRPGSESRLQPVPLSRRLCAVFCFTVCLAVGCATGPGRGSDIDALHVFSVPVALDLDGLPGPDGFSLTLYASTDAGSKGVPIRHDRLEILMFDGALSTDATINAEPRRVWTFTAAELKNHVIQTSLGTGYRFTVRWIDTPPVENRITILARFLSSHGTSVQSAPTAIAVREK